jgi:hypothetical protein
MEYIAMVFAHNYVVSYRTAHFYNSFPFHGNALFAECGEAFAALAMHNPNIASEERLLEKTAPSLPEGTRSRLARAFAELRVRSDTGALSYPFSMRECLSVARHLEVR